ncbi:MAG: BatA domain-containing protein [Melioribacteraceae bacterium]|nr:BatA domain-containing protein [Melioribacteraceae bacterium]
MTFLNPAILFGLLAASIPVVIHLFNLRQLKKIEFSSLMFLKTLQKNKIRKIKFKQWLLLLIRVLIIMSLVFAFSRPTMKNISLLGFGENAKTSAVIILDNSFSMSVVSPSGSYFNIAKKSALNILDNLEQGDEAAVLLISDLRENKINFTQNIAMLKRTIEKAEISGYSGTINMAMVKAATIVDESKNYNKEIYLLTDFQKSRIYNDPSELSDLSFVLNKNVRLFGYKLPQNEISNMGITDFKAENQLFEIGKIATFKADIENYSGSRLTNSVASLFINGKRTAQQSFDIDPQTSRELTFETTIISSGLSDISVELEDDDLLFDNKRYLSINIPESIAVNLISQNKKNAEFISFLLSSNSNFTTGNSTKSNVNVLIGNESSRVLEELKNDIENGGSLIIFPGENSDLAEYQNICKIFELDLPNLIVGKKGSFLNPTKFNKVDFNHPLFKNLFQDENTQLESPLVNYYFKTNSTQKTQSIINLIDGSELLVEKKLGRGKILAFYIAPVLSWSDMPLKPIFPALIARSIIYLSTGIKEDRSVISGEPIIASLSNRRSSKIEIVTPKSESQYINADSLINKKYLTYPYTDELGVYKFYDNKQLLDYFVVNAIPSESIIKYGDRETIEKYLEEIKYKNNFTELNYDSDISKIIYESRFGIELWKYFITLALLLAIAEMMIGKNSKKDISELRK